MPRQWFPSCQQCSGLFRGFQGFDILTLGPLPAQLGMCRIDFLYERRDALEVKTPLSAFPRERIGNPRLLQARRMRPHAGTCGAGLQCRSACCALPVLAQHRMPSRRAHLENGGHRVRARRSEHAQPCHQLDERLPKS